MDAPAASPDALPEGSLPFIRISLAQSAEKQQRQIAAFIESLALCRGNQVWLAKRMDETDRTIRKQIATARSLGTDIPLRAIEVMKQRGIVPYLSTPPGSPPVTFVPEIFAAAIERATSRYTAPEPAQVAKKFARKRAKKVVKKAPKRGASAKNPA